MNHEDLRKAREQLRLTVQEAAEMLETDVTTIRKMELPPEAAQARKPPARVVRLYKLYLAGARPDDWPDRVRSIDAHARALGVS